MARKKLKIQKIVDSDVDRRWGQTPWAGVLEGSYIRRMAGNGYTR